MGSALSRQERRGFSLMEWFSKQNTRRLQQLENERDRKCFVQEKIVDICSEWAVKRKFSVGLYYVFVRQVLLCLFKSLHAIKKSFQNVKMKVIN